VIRRREFITLLGGAAAWPVAVSAQQLPVIGYLSSLTPSVSVHVLAGFRQGLTETGYIEHRSVGIEYRWAEGQYDRLPALAADLINHRVAVIFATGGLLPALAAKDATTSIPIVFQGGGDPVQRGLVASFNRPGGNVTGISNIAGPLLDMKGLELLHELVPKVAKLGYLFNPTNSGLRPTDLQAAAGAVGVELALLTADTEASVDAVFPTLDRHGIGALLISSDPFFFSRVGRLAALSVRHAVPASWVVRDFAAAGGLMSYGTNLAETNRLGGVYVGRILKGEKPADLPIQQPTKFEFVLNLKTAKALGLTVPDTVLARADEVIE
jgi:putative ABC transport system substrate-binding protein